MLFHKNNIFLISLVLLLFSYNSWAQTPPELSATGNQAYCPLDNINIVTLFSIVPGDEQIDAVFIQISENYNKSDDTLFLENLASHPNVSSSWNAQEGKLTLESVTPSSTAYNELVAAVYDVVFNSNSSTSTGEKHFSFTVDEANYLPSTGHYYEYISSPGITWTSAQAAADNLPPYYGVLTPYLATITSEEEAVLCGKQALNTGWIGGSDAETEGVWKWVTGPEAGMIFWNGLSSISSPPGSSPPGVYSYWDNGEPNQWNGNNEDYAHITYPNINKPGSWNDFPNSAGTTGYIVEYGGMPGDPVLNVSASTTIYIPEIINPFGDSRCGRGTITLSATATSGDVVWFDVATGGAPIFTGPNFTTPSISDSTNYYVLASENGCVTGVRTSIIATIKTIPTITSVSPPTTICGAGTATLTATASAGEINWYANALGGGLLKTGNSYSPTISTTTTYYVDATDKECTSKNRTPVTLYVNPLPEFKIEADLKNVICINSPQPITLSVVYAKDIYTYEWFFEDEFFSDQLEVTISKGGEYKAVATYTSTGCTSQQNISIIESEIATITQNDITITDDSDNNTITINNQNNNLGIGDYEFALDDDFGPYQDAPVFEMVEPGIYTIYVNDKYGCGIAPPIEVSVIGYPKFFTPNYDGINDTWQVKGVSANFYPTSLIYIFDRFGKLITTVDPTLDGWNGLYNNEVLPATDYWFTAQLIDENGSIREKKGHFSLIR